MNVTRQIIKTQTRNDIKKKKTFFTSSYHKSYKKNFKTTDVCHNNNHDGLQLAQWYNI